MFCRYVRLAEATTAPKTRGDWFRSSRHLSAHLLRDASSMARLRGLGVRPANTCHLHVLAHHVASNRRWLLDPII